MTASEPHVTRSTDASAWSPPWPEAPGFAHLVVETPGLRSHVATIGEGEPVVLLHGFPQHWWQWRVVAPVIAAGGYRVICPDLRGATAVDASPCRRSSSSAAATSPGPRRT